MSNFKRFIYGTDNHKLETEMNIEIDDHKIALLVNAITAELKPFTKTQSLRARVSGIVLEHLKPKAGTSCGRSANNLNQNKLKKYDHNRKRSEIS